MPETGGCRDGLHVDRVNGNQGAESTLAFLLSLVEMRQAQNMLTSFKQPITAEIILPSYLLWFEEAASHKDSQGAMYRKSTFSVPSSVKKRINRRNAAQPVIHCGISSPEALRRVKKWDPNGKWDCTGDFL